MYGRRAIRAERMSEYYRRLHVQRQKERVRDILLLCRNMIHSSKHIEHLIQSGETRKVKI